MIATIKPPKAIISDNASKTLMRAPFRVTTQKNHRHHSHLSIEASHRPAFPCLNHHTQLLRAMRVTSNLLTVCYYLLVRDHECRLNYHASEDSPQAATADPAQTTTTIAAIIGLCNPFQMKNTNTELISTRQTLRYLPKTAPGSRTLVHQQALTLTRWRWWYLIASQRAHAIRGWIRSR